MAKIKCSNCINVREPLEVRKGIGKNNVEYIKTMGCKLGFEISLGGIPGTRCNGKYFKPKQIV